MSQLFHVIMEKQDVRLRLPLKPGDKYLSKYVMHPDHEERQFLRPLGDYAMASIDDQAKAQQILSEGFVHTDGSHWWAAGGYVRDDGAVFVLLPEQVTDTEFFRRLGMRVDLAKWSDSFKVGKYIKRLWSHHRRYIEGDVVEKHNDVLTVRLSDGKIISVRYVRGKSPLTEGMNLVSGRCLKMLGINGKLGTGLRITALSPEGFSKGHAIVLDHLKFDLVLFDSKDMLRSDGKFVFALDELHSGNLFTDPQSVINFRMYQGPFMNQWADTFKFQVADALQDEEKLRNMLQFYNVDFHIWQREEAEHGGHPGEYIFKEKDWALLRALRAGLPVTKVPALLRKVYHLFMNKVMNCETKMRIPVQPEVGGARYILVDPTIFDMWGDPSLEGVLRGNQVYCPGHIGPVVFHRQPNAHRSEHHIANSVLIADHIAMDEGSFMFISKDVVEPVMKKLGGGDQDDRVVFYKDPDVVNHFSQLDAYPVETIVKPKAPERRANRFDIKLLRPRPVYDRTQIGIMLANQQQQRVNIGQAVNPIMMDAIITDQIRPILDYLIHLEPKDAKITKALAEMQKFQGYRMKSVASQLELIIDAIKRDGADTSAISEELRNFWQWLPVVPQCCVRRLPPSRKGDNLPVVVITDLDIILSDIHQSTVELEDYVVELSWQVVANENLPLEILTYPGLDDPTILQLALAISTFYHHQRELLMGGIETDEAKDRIAAFMKVDENVFNQFKNHPLILDAMIQLYKIIYSRKRAEAPLDAEGNPRPFPDGLLWAPRMGGLMIKALDRAGLTGRYVPVEYYDDSRRYKRDTHDVNINEGIVNISGTDTQVGMIDPVADGQTRMERGLVRVPTKNILPVESDDVEILTVVAGWTTRPDATPKALEDWRKHANEEVDLVPYVHYNEETSEEEHAVRVLLADGTEYGNITRRDAANIIVPTKGWLAPGKSARTMQVVLKGGRS